MTGTFITPHCVFTHMLATSIVYRTLVFICKYNIFIYGKTNISMILSDVYFLLVKQVNTCLSTNELHLWNSKLWKSKKNCICMSKSYSLKNCKKYIINDFYQWRKEHGIQFFGLSYLNWTQSSEYCSQMWWRMEELIHSKFRGRPNLVPPHCSLGSSHTHSLAINQNLPVIWISCTKFMYCYIYK